MERFYIVRRSDGNPSGEYKSYAYISSGTIVAAIDESRNLLPLVELDGYEGLFRIDENRDLRPITFDYRFSYESNL